MYNTQGSHPHGCRRVNYVYFYLVKGTKMENKILSEIRKIVPDNITGLLPADKLDPAVLFLLQHTQDTVTEDK